MGLLVEGKCVDQWYDTKATKGRFARSEAQFRNWVTADGSAGPTGEGGFKAEAGRYHLYVSLGSPNADFPPAQRLGIDDYHIGGQPLHA